MQYPKFPRRTLALILFCMVMTLGAVGLIFLVYFFNESSTLLLDSSLKSVYVDDKPTGQQYRQNLIEIEKNEYKTDQELLSLYTNYVENDQVRIDNSTSILKASQELEANRKKQAVPSPKTINTKGLKDTYTNSDTIYIDDFDRPTFSSKARSELGNIDYFDTIIVDHKNVAANKKPEQQISSEEASPSIIYKTRIYSESSSSPDSRNSNESEVKPRINNKRRTNAARWEKNRLSKIRKDDDVYDSEVETAGSGSGDFFDDTEVNEVFIKQLNTKANRKDKNSKKYSKLYDMRRRRKKNRVFIRVGNKFISTSPTFSTMPTEDNQLNWDYQKNFKKLSSYPTNPTIHYSQSVANKKQLPVPAMFTNSANSPTSSYNDNFQSQLEVSEVGSAATVKTGNHSANNQRDIGAAVATGENNEAWIETRTRRIMGNVKKSEERSRQLLLCEEAGGGELCRMLFKGHIND